MEGQNRILASAVGLLLRFLFIQYARWHDKNVHVKYTDIDYEVFTDAANFVHQGMSPYEEETYKYTPLLAWMLLPNITHTKLFGKVLFSILDVLTGYMMCCMVECKPNVNVYCRYLWKNSNSVIFIGILWLWNPFVITISTRGSAEAVQSFLVIGTLYFLENNKIFYAGAFYGLSIHFKIYPILFSLPIFLHLWFNQRKQRKNGFWNTVMNSIFSILSTGALWKFFVTSIIVFIGLTVLMYSRYGFSFLQETYLYHFSRTDLKHNFSPYFYVLYLIKDSSIQTCVGLAAFLPQASCVLWLGYQFYDQLPLACFLQIFAFVAFNKVCTSQYFIWYLNLLPLALVYLKIEHREGIKMIIAWLSAQDLWLALAYLFEFRGYDILHLVWVASLLFLGVNIWILVTLIYAGGKIRDNMKEMKD